MQTSLSRKKSCFILVLFINLFIILYAWQMLMTRHSESGALRGQKLSALNDRVCKRTSKKWIVLTTIFYPSPAVELFLSLNEWMLVVIGDRKTPSDWLSRVRPSLQEKVIYLSVSDQKKLEYGIVKFLPENSYARKNIGYLVAIQCGAEVIFESDDDNFIEDKSIKVLPKLSSPQHIPKIAFHGKRSPFVNIYGSFGEPTIWPRGFPIDELKNVTEDGWSSLRSNHENINAFVQQFLADDDPDVDALYRLSHPLKVGHIRFNRQQTTIALEPFTFSPYNTQNTVTHYEAFWGLFLPVTTTFRVCDIWRSFWVQRLLWDIDGRLVFFGPTVKQKRNAHRYLKDMEEEQQMYYQTSAFVRFLSSWNSSATTLFERIRSLAYDIGKAGYWNPIEATYLNVWLNDLYRAGYRPPALASANRTRRSPVDRRHVAVCVTGRLACTNKTWFLFEKQLMSKFKGSVDIFFYLSSSVTTTSCKCFNSVPFIYNTTMQILYADRNFNDVISKTRCPLHSNLSIIEKNDYLHDLWAQAQCYELVKQYQSQMNVQYELMIRAQFGILLRNMPNFDERTTPLNVSQTVLIPYDITNDQVYDKFSIGPLEKMSLYMNRWVHFDNCSVRSMLPQKYLRTIYKQQPFVALDTETSVDFFVHQSDIC